MVDATGNASIYPDLSQREETASVHYINNSIGINLPPNEVSIFLQSTKIKIKIIIISCVCKIANLLRRMGLTARLTNHDNDVVVLVPPTRSDILHACDVMEDVAIAYGYNNLTLTVPPTPTIAKQQPLNKFTDLLRHEIAFAGYSEAFTFSLVCATFNDFCKYSSFF